MILSLFGHGVTTKAIAKRFAPNCLIYDDKFTKNSQDEFGNKLLVCDEYDPNLSDFEVPVFCQITDLSKTPNAS